MHGSPPSARTTNHTAPPRPSEHCPEHSRDAFLVSVVSGSAGTEQKRRPYGGALLHSEVKAAPSVVVGTLEIGTAFHHLAYLLDITCRGRLVQRLGSARSTPVRSLRLGYFADTSVAECA